MNLTLENLKLLYVEDEDMIRDEIVDFLELRVKEVIVAVDGEDGLNKYKIEKPDMVITDIKMPKMNGLQMARQIKEMDKNTPIIITTAHSDTEYFVESIDIGINQFVLKPIMLDKLMKSIEKCLKL